MYTTHMDHGLNQKGSLLTQSSEGGAEKGKPLLVSNSQKIDRIVQFWKSKNQLFVSATILSCVYDGPLLRIITLHGASPLAGPH